jgi:hypothetical protein
MWSQQAYIKAKNTGAGHRFGHSLSLTADGNTLAVGASRENSNATGVDGNANNSSASQSGAVYLFTRDRTVWSQTTYIKASNTGIDDEFGRSVSLSSEGSMLAVGATSEGSSATGVGGNESDNSAINSGAVYVFVGQ